MSTIFCKKKKKKKKKKAREEEEDEEEDDGRKVREANAVSSWAAEQQTTLGHHTKPVNNPRRAKKGLENKEGHTARNHTKKSPRTFAFYLFSPNTPPTLAYSFPCLVSLAHGGGEAAAAVPEVVLPVQPKCLSDDDDDDDHGDDGDENRQRQNGNEN